MLSELLRIKLAYRKNRHHPLKDRKVFLEKDSKSADRLQLTPTYPLL